MCQYSSYVNEDLVDYMINNLSYREVVLKGRKFCIIKEKWFMVVCKFCKKKMYLRVYMKRYIRLKYKKEFNFVGYIIGDCQIDEVGDFFCVECNNRKFKIYNVFVIYMNRRYGDSDVVICEFCNKVLFGRNSFLQYMKSKKYKKKEMMRYLVNKGGKKEEKLEDVKEENDVKEEDIEKEMKIEEIKKEVEEDEGNEYIKFKYNIQKLDVLGMYERAYNNYYLKKFRGFYKKRGRKLVDKFV